MMKEEAINALKLSKKEVSLKLDSLQKEWLTEFASMRTDDVSTGVFVRSLEKFIPYIVAQKYAAADIETFVLTKADLEFGEDTITHTFEEAFGTAKYGLLTDDIPYAEVTQSEEGSNIASIRFGYRYTREQLEASMISMRNRKNPIGNSLIARKMAAALRSLKEVGHLAGCYGSPQLNLYGLFNNPHVTVYDETSLDVLGAATAEQLYEWFIDRLVSIKKDTELVGEVDTIIMSIDLYKKLCIIRPASASDVTAKDLIYKAMTDMGVQRFLIRNEVSKIWLEEKGNYAPGTNKDLLMFYNSSPEVVERHVSSIDTSPLEYGKNNYEQFFRQRISSVQFNYPKEALYVTYPNVL